MGILAELQLIAEHVFKFNPYHDQKGRFASHGDSGGMSGGLLNVSGWKRVGAQGGSNPGGVFEDPSGTQHYVKFPQRNPEQARAEKLSDEIYRTLGIPVKESVVVTDGTRLGLAGKMLEGSKEIGQRAVDQSPDVAKGYVADAYLASWDVFGMTYDNILGDDTHDYRVDNGGTLFYRAQGELKKFPSDRVDELDSLIASGKKGYTAFARLTADDKQAQAHHLVSTLTNAKLLQLIAQAGLSGMRAQEYYTALTGRRDVIARRFGVQKIDHIFKMNPYHDEVGRFTTKAAAAAIQRGEAHTVTEDEFLNYHNTGYIEPNAYERYEAGDLDFIQRKDFDTLLDTRTVNGKTVEIRLATEPQKYLKYTVALSDAERDHLYEEYEQEAKRLGTTPMMAGIDLGRDSDAYKALNEFDKRWRNSGTEIVRDAQGLAVYLTPEEVQAQGKSAVVYTVGAFVGDKTIGYAGDEFGASGVYLSREYQRHGLGLTLFKTYLEKSGKLGRGSKIGQMTPVGQELVRALHRQLVREARKRDEWVFKRNPYHDEVGRFTSKDKAQTIGAGPAQGLVTWLDQIPSEAQLIESFLWPDDRKEFLAASKEASRLFTSGQDTRTLNTKPGTKSYSKDRLKIHHAIVEKFLENPDRAKPQPGEKPRMVMLGGRPGSGKSNFNADKPNPNHPGFGKYSADHFIVVDPDRVKELFPEYHPERAALVHDESKDVFNKIVNAARKRGLNIVLDFTMNDDKVAWVRKFKQANYQTEAYYLHRPLPMAAENVLKRWSHPLTIERLDGTKKTFTRGRLVPLPVVLKNTQNEKNFDRVSRLVDQWELWDNSVGSFTPKYVAGNIRKFDHWTHVFKINPYHDKGGQFTSKDKAVMPGWYKSSSGGTVFSVTSEGNIAHHQNLALHGMPADPEKIGAGPFKSQAAARAAGLDFGKINPITEISTGTAIENALAASLPTPETAPKFVEDTDPKVSPYKSILDIPNPETVVASKPFKGPITKALWLQDRLDIMADAKIKNVHNEQLHGTGENSIHSFEFDLHSNVKAEAMLEKLKDAYQKKGYTLVEGAPKHPIEINLKQNTYRVVVTSHGLIHQGVLSGEPVQSSAETQTLPATALTGKALIEQDLEAIRLELGLEKPILQSTAYNDPTLDVLDSRYHIESGDVVALDAFKKRLEDKGYTLVTGEKPLGPNEAYVAQHTTFAGQTSLYVYLAKSKVQEAVPPVDDQKWLTDLFTGPPEKMEGQYKFQQDATEIVGAFNDGNMTNGRIYLYQNNFDQAVLEFFHTTPSAGDAENIVLEMEQKFKDKGYLIKEVGIPSQPNEVRVRQSNTYGERIIIQFGSKKIEDLSESDEISIDVKVAKPITASGTKLAPSKPIELYEGQVKFHQDSLAINKEFPTLSIENSKVVIHPTNGEQVMAQYEYSLPEEEHSAAKAYLRKEYEKRGYALAEPGFNPWTPGEVGVRSEGGKIIINLAGKPIGDTITKFGTTHHVLMDPMAAAPVPSSAPVKSFISDRTEIQSSLGLTLDTTVVNYESETPHSNGTDVIHLSRYAFSTEGDAALMRSKIQQAYAAKGYTLVQDDMHFTAANQVRVNYEGNKGLVVYARVNKNTMAAGVEPEVPKVDFSKLTPSEQKAYQKKVEHFTAKFKEEYVARTLEAGNLAAQGKHSAAELKLAPLKTTEKKLFEYGMTPEAYKALKDEHNAIITEKKITFRKDLLNTMVEERRLDAVISEMSYTDPARDAMQVTKDALVKKIQELRTGNQGLYQQLGGAAAVKRMTEDEYTFQKYKARKAYVQAFNSEPGDPAVVLAARAHAQYWGNSTHSIGDSVLHPEDYSTAVPTFTTKEAAFEAVKKATIAYGFVKEQKSSEDYEYYYKDPARLDQIHALTNAYVQQGGQVADLSDQAGTWYGEGKKQYQDQKVAIQAAKKKYTNAIATVAKAKAESDDMGYPTTDMHENALKTLTAELHKEVPANVLGGMVEAAIVVGKTQWETEKKQYQEEEIKGIGPALYKYQYNRAKFGDDHEETKKAWTHYVGLQKTLKYLKKGDVDTLWSLKNTAVQNALAIEEKFKNLSVHITGTVAQYDAEADSFKFPYGDYEFENRHTKLRKELSPAQQQSITNYTGSDFREINKAIAQLIDPNDPSLGGDTFANNQTTKHIKNIDAGLAGKTIGQNVKTMRSFPSTYLFRQLGFDQKNDDPQSLVGKVYTENVFSSTSINETWTSSYSGQTGPSLLATIRAGKDMPGLYVAPISGTSASEKELLLPRGATYVIKAIKSHSGYSSYGKWEIEMDLIGYLPKDLGL